MGVWGRLKAVVNGPRGLGPGAGKAVMTGTDRPVSHIDTTTSEHYAAEKERTDVAEQKARMYRAGYMSAAEAKALLTAGEDSRPPLHLVSSNDGLDFATSDGQLVDYNTLALRHFGIFAFRAVGMSYHENPSQPFKFSVGQPVGILREPDNEHDRNAVALTTGSPARKFGYVNKQRARWVAALLDNGQHLEALVIQSARSSPRVLITTPEMLAYLYRR